MTFGRSMIGVAFLVLAGLLVRNAPRAAITAGLDEYPFGAAALAFVEGALRSDPDLLDSGRRGVAASGRSGSR